MAWSTIGLIWTPSRTTRISCHDPASTTSMSTRSGAGSRWAVVQRSVSTLPSSLRSACTVTWAPSRTVGLPGEAAHLDRLDADGKPTQRHRRRQLDIQHVVGEPGERVEHPVVGIVDL